MIRVFHSDEIAAMVWLKSLWERTHFSFKIPIKSSKIQAFQPKSLYINLSVKTLNNDSQWENEAGRELAN
jgi:hypothetical protein